MRKRSIFLILGCLLFAGLLSSCGTRDKNYTATVEAQPLSEKEIIAFVKDYMLKKYNDDVDVTIDSKRGLRYETYVGPGLDGGYSLFDRKYVDVAKGHSYTVQITNKLYGISALGTYRDGFSLYNKETKTTEFIDREVHINSNYENDRAYAMMEADLKEIMAGYVSNLRFYEDVTDNETAKRFYNFYLCDEDAEAACEGLKKVVERCIGKYWYIDHIRVFVFTEADIYGSIDFNVLNNPEFVSDYEENAAPEVLRRSDLEQRPYVLLEKYFGGGLTPVASSEGLEPQTGSDKIKEYDHVVYLLDGDPKAYERSLGSKPEELKYGKTDVYAFEWEKLVK